MKKIFNKTIFISLVFLSVAGQVSAQSSTPDMAAWSTNRGAANTQGNMLVVGNLEDCNGACLNSAHSGGLTENQWNGLTPSGNGQDSGDQGATE